MSDQPVDDQQQSPRDDGFGVLDRTEEQRDVADVNLDDPNATDDVPWSPPDGAPIHSQFPDDPEEETIDQRIAQEEPEHGTAYGAPEPEGILGGADDVAHQERVGGDDPDAIPEEDDFLEGPA